MSFLPREGAGRMKSRRGWCLCLLTQADARLHAPPDWPFVPVQPREEFVGLQDSFALAPWLHARSPGSACSGVIRNEPLDPPVSDPRRQCHRRSLHPVGRYPKDLLAWLSGRKYLCSPALTRRWPRRPMHHRPEFRTSPWTPLATVRTQYMSVSGAVSSGGRCSTLLETKALKSDEI